MMVEGQTHDMRYARFVKNRFL